MQNYFQFVLQMFKNPNNIGAVLPSSRFLAKKIVSNIVYNPNNKIVIVEYGAGTGVFTDEIIKILNYNSKLIVIENNPFFYNLLQKKYQHFSNVSIILDGAENIVNIIDSEGCKKIDYIISGLPFTSLPKSLSHQILEKTSSIMNKNTSFITFQYTNHMKNDFLQYFNIQKNDKVLINIPPAIVYSFSKK